MNFEKAWKEMINKGSKVKLPSWGGYWIWDEEKQTILIHEKDGNIVEFNSPKLRVKYSIENMLRDDWVIADSNNCPLLGGIAKFGLDDAIRYAKRGLKIRMNWWPEELYVNSCDGYTTIDTENEEIEESYVIFSNIEDNSYFYRTIDSTLNIEKNNLMHKIFDPSKSNGYWTWFNDETKEVRQEELDTNSNSSIGVTFDDVCLCYTIEEVIANITTNNIKFRLDWWPENAYVDKVIDISYDGNKVIRATLYNDNGGTFNLPDVRYYYIRKETEVYKSTVFIDNKNLLKPEDVVEHWVELDTYKLLGISRDACLYEIQKYIETVALARGIDKVSLPNEVLMLSEEVGEVCKAVRQFVKTSPNDKHSKQRELAYELADVFIVLLNICIKSNINLHDAFINKEFINHSRKWD